MGEQHSSPSILLVEDEADIRETLAEILEYEGYRVVTACDGAAAVTLLECGLRPALIILDLLMPNMTGEEFLQRVRAHPDWAHLTVVINSGTADLARKAELLGANDHFLKPLEISVLLEFTKRYCGVLEDPPDDRPLLGAQSSSEWRDDLQGRVY
jgi:two-component system, chemotaxis family, chemotaxis protein CheY